MTINQKNKYNTQNPRQAIIMTDKKTLLEFPCKFPIKVMGEPDVGLEDFVRDTLAEKTEKPDTVEVRVRMSEKGNFISITATFEAQHLDELNALYEIFSNHPDVKVAL